MCGISDLNTCRILQKPDFNYRIMLITLEWRHFRHRRHNGHSRHSRHVEERPTMASHRSSVRRRSLNTPGVETNRVTVPHPPLLDLYIIYYRSRYDLLSIPLITDPCSTCAGDCAICLCSLRQTDLDWELCDHVFVLLLSGHLNYWKTYQSL